MYIVIMGASFSRLPLLIDMGHINLTQCVCLSLFLIAFCDSLNIALRGSLNTAMNIAVKNNAASGSLLLLGNTVLTLSQQSTIQGVAILLQMRIGKMDCSISIMDIWCRVFCNKRLFPMILFDV